MRQDSERDFEAFVLQRGASLLRTAYLLTGDRGQAEDLLQDVLGRVYLNWERITEGQEPTAYVRRSLTNASLSRWRRLRTRVREVPLDGAGPDTGSRPTSWAADASDGVAQRDELGRALQRLSPRQRAVLVLRFWEDLSEADTAAALGVSAGTVKSQTSRGLARMRDLLGPPGSPAGPDGPSPRPAADPDPADSTLATFAPLSWRTR